jgi:hypothetical protein
MPRPRPLEPRLGATFRVDDARRLGETPGRLRGDDLSRPFHGVRSSNGNAGWRAYALLLRDGDRFSHSTAAELWGAPLPRRFEGAVHVASPREMSRAKGRGVRGHSSGTIHPVTRHGVPVSDPATTFLELAALLDLDALVAVGDYLTLDPRRLDPLDIRPYVSLGQLLSTVRRSTGRGVVRARAAALLIRPGVESPMETRLRLLLVRAGIPEPICGYPVSTRRGQHIGHFDLAWPEHRVLAEYDGDQHRASTDQYDRDIRRFDQASDEGWRVIRVRMKDFRAPASIVDRVARALRR